MFIFILLDFASIFYEALSISSLSKSTFVLSKNNNRLLVFIVLIALLDDSLDFYCQVAY